MENTSNECSATFVVRVTKKNGERWKGDVSEVIVRKTQKFDSMQELFELMDSALEKQSSAQVILDGGAE